MRFIWIIAILCSSVLNAQDIKVKLFSQYDLESVWVTTHESDFHLLATDGQWNEIDTISDLYPEASVRTLLFKENSGRVEILFSGKSLGSYEGLKLSRKGEGHFIISGKGKERIYTGDILMRSYQSHLQVVNLVNLEEYVAGVVESEGGHVTDLEYFKAQAVLARTWVLKNLNKHNKEGYNVKDDVTSQAYYSKAYLQNSQAILNAVEATRDLVLVDQQGDLVFGAFHSNSGGQTSNSEDIWSEKIGYLRSVKDTFSLKGDKAYWEKEIDKDEFLEFFSSKLNASQKDTAFVNAVTHLKMEDRKPWFEWNNKKLKMRDVRTKFKLRSSFFSVEEKGNTLYLKGKGFGHGVGLSQQGAMQMARLGMTYDQILKFYFQGVELVPKSEILSMK